MINGKFFTGLPPKMIDRSNGVNRQQTNFFWPDDTQNQSAVESRVKRRSSIQAETRDAYTPRGDQSNSDAENKERFKKEFTKSSIQFYDNVEQTPLRRNRQKTFDPPPVKPQNVEPPPNTSGKRKEAFSSRIQFYDFPEDNLNNVPKTDKNNKVEVERNSKNSPKLQNKRLSFEPPDEPINFIENNVRNMKITAPPRRRNTVRDNRPRYGRREDQHFSDFAEDYTPPRRHPLPPPPVGSRYPESDQDFDDYSPRRLPVNRRPMYYDNSPVDFLDGFSPRPFDGYSDEGASSFRRTGRQVRFNYTGGHEHHTSIDAEVSQDYSPHPQIPRHLKVDNDIKNNEQTTIPIAGTTSPPPTSPPSHKHLVSNICFSDTESTGTPPCPPKRNIRSSAVARVSVGLPD